MKDKTIIILGAGDSAKTCDFNADQIWVINGSYILKGLAKPEDKERLLGKVVFCACAPFKADGKNNFDINLLNSLTAEYNGRFVSLHTMQEDGVRLGATIIPYNKIVKKFRGDTIFTNTVSYVIAYLLYRYSDSRSQLKHPLTIRLFGIDMYDKPNYVKARVGVEYWLGVARGMGAKIEVAKGSALRI